MGLSIASPSPPPSLVSPPPPPTAPSRCSNQLEKVPDGIITDPTLGRNPSVECPKCTHRGAVYIMPKITAADDRIKLIFVCTNGACVHKWQL